MAAFAHSKREEDRKKLPFLSMIKCLSFLPNGKVIFLNELPDDLYKFFDLICLDDRDLSE